MRGREFYRGMQLGGAILFGLVVVLLLDLIIPK